MAANADTTKKAIAPGSIPFGERQGVEAGLEAVLGGGGEGQAPPSVPRISSDDPFSSPMAALEGKGGFESNLPITAGLSVGPGPGPMPGLNDMPVPVVQRLQDVALHAKTPHIRQMALIALRRLARENMRQT